MNDSVLVNDSVPMSDSVIVSDSVLVFLCFSVPKSDRVLVFQ